MPPRFTGHKAKVRVLEGVLEVLVDGEPVARHALREARFRRTILPEHEAEFRARSTSRHVLQDQFLRLGPAARDFVDGLIAEHQGAAGYHMSRILGLCEKAGIPRVGEALRHAVRYGAFDFNTPHLSTASLDAAVARILKGKTDQPVSASLTPAPLPERIADYLRGAGEHQRSLRAYQRLLIKTDKEPNDGQ